MPNDQGKTQSVILLLLKVKTTLVKKNACYITSQSLTTCQKQTRQVIKTRGAHYINSQSLTRRQKQTRQVINIYRHCLLETGANKKS